MAIRYYFEDLHQGQNWTFGTWSLSADEIVAFGREYDPQPIHTDPQFAGTTAFGGVIASGWQSCLKCIRLFVDQVMRETAGLSSPGLSEVSWFKPVKPGEPITARAEVTKVEPSETRPDRGKVHFHIFGTDAAGKPVVSMRGFFFIARRPVDKAADAS
jgi:acyl dehydratase